MDGKQLYNDFRQLWLDRGGFCTCFPSPSLPGHGWLTHDPMLTIMNPDKDIEHQQPALPSDGLMVVHIIKKEDSIFNRRRAARKPA